MIDPNNFYFYLIFISQILLISGYIPKTITIRIQTVREKYPVDLYPKLYTKPIAEHIKMQSQYASANRVLLTIGFSLLSAIIMWDYKTKGDISQMIPWAYFMLQMIPLAWLEVKEFKYFKAMRAVNTNTTKTADFQPRKLLDFISPKLLLTALALMIVAFALAIFHLGWSVNAFENMAVIFVTNLFFAGVIYWNIYGKKQDPHQSSSDRTKVIKITIKSILLTSIAVSIFLASQMLINMFQADFIEPIIMSLYCQIIAWGSILARLNSMKLEDIDFSVYKEQSIEES